MPQRAQVLDIEPKEVICFKGPFTRTVTETVRLTNPTSKKIAFKVKTTDTKHCCINPCKGVIDAGSTVSITIMVQPRTQPVDGERTPPKFLFQAIEVPEGELRLDELVKLFKSANPDNVMDSRLTCVFENPSGEVESGANNKPDKTPIAAAEARTSGGGGGEQQNVVAAATNVRARRVQAADAPTDQMELSWSDYILVGGIFVALIIAVIIVRKFS